MCIYIRIYTINTNKFKQEVGPLGGQWFGTCLWPRAGSWSPGIEFHIGLLAWSLLLPLPVCLPLSLYLS